MLRIPLLLGLTIFLHIFLSNHALSVSTDAILFGEITYDKGKRQTMRQSLKSTPPIIGDVASCIRPEDYLTMA